MELGLGHLGLTPEVFWDMTPYEFKCALKGYEQKQKIGWEQIRWQTWHLLNIQLSKKDKLKYTDLQLPYEAAKKAKEKPELTPEQIEEGFAKFDKPVKDIRIAKLNEIK